VFIGFFCAGKCWRTCLILLYTTGNLNVLLFTSPPYIIPLQLNSYMQHFTEWCYLLQVQFGQCIHVNVSANRPCEKQTLVSNFIQGLCLYYSLFCHLWNISFASLSTKLALFKECTPLLYVIIIFSALESDISVFK